MKHPNVVTLEKVYADFVRGDFQAMLSACSDSVTFQVPGKSRLAGKYTKSTFNEFAAKLSELSGGTFKLETHDILASDQHGVVLATEKLTQGGKPAEFRMVHVWRFEGGKPVAWYAYPRDLYQFDAAWG
jgi:ketosteroid isomerase-like protein